MKLKTTLGSSTAPLRFPALFRHLRTTKGLTQEHLAAACGKKQSYVAGIESGAHMPSANVLASLIKVMGLAPSQVARLVGSIVSEEEAVKLRRALTMGRSDFSSTLDLWTKFNDDGQAEVAIKYAYAARELATTDVEESRALIAIGTSWASLERYEAAEHFLVLGKRRAKDPAIQERARVNSAEAMREKGDPDMALPIARELMSSEDLVIAGGARVVVANCLRDLERPESWTEGHALLMEAVDIFDELGRDGLASWARIFATAFDPDMPKDEKLANLRRMRDVGAATGDEGNFVRASKEILRINGSKEEAAPMLELARERGWLHTIEKAARWISGSILVVGALLGSARLTHARGEKGFGSALADAACQGVAAVASFDS